MSAKTLMILGTGSGVGKSILTAAFCRYFYLKGIRVAPFKAQNMSLNSFVTPDGGEIGRAQAYQAEACGILPAVEMNPILLKPSGDNQSQVIVLGKVAGSRDAKNYFAERGRYVPEVLNAFERLRSQYELIVLEGAGSPAEINLKSHDFVNMFMAEKASAPVILVGDIDRGGVFAWMKGTLDLLTESERRRIAGCIINKFRGDIDLLKPGLDQFRDMTGKPIFGVVPFRRDLFVDEEDELPVSGFNGIDNPGKLDIVVLRLPRISNFTDFFPLMHDPEIRLRYAWRADQIGRPDLLIIPGSKNTLDDLDFLHSGGLSQAVIQCHEQGVPILGVCAGFQMLGKTVHDPLHVESRKGTLHGLGLLDMSTTLAAEKITRLVDTTSCDSPAFINNTPVKAYEIHMGRTQFNNEYQPLFRNSDKRADPQLGVCDPSGSILGTYLHGCLDNNDLRHQLLAHVRKMRGLPPPTCGFDYQGFRESNLNRLAELIEHNIDMQSLHPVIFG